MGYNSILDRLVEKYPNAEGINDARNIAEAVAAINGVGGRGANAIADQIQIVEETTTDDTETDSSDTTSDGTDSGSIVDPEPTGNDNGTTEPSEPGGGSIVDPEGT